MYKNLLFHIAFILISIKSVAQTTAVPRINCFDSLVIPDSINFFFLGENHQMNNAPHKIELIKHLYTNWGVTEIAIEFPRTLEKRVNDYISYGDLDAFDEIKETRFQNQRDQWAVLIGIRKLNTGLCAKNKLHITCFDMAMDVRRIALIEVEAMLLYHNNPRLDKLYDLAKSSINEKKLERVIRLMREELIQNIQIYYDILGSDLFALNGAINAAEITAKYIDTSLANDSLSMDRENFLSSTLNNAMERFRIKKMIVFTGSFHTSKLEYDEITESNSTNYILQNEYSWNTLSFITIYHNKKRNFFGRLITEYIDYIDMDFFKYHKDRQMRFLFFWNEEFIDSEILYDRCDGIIVKDCNVRWR